MCARVCGFVGDMEVCVHVYVCVYVFVCVCVIVSLKVLCVSECFHLCVCV